MRDLDKLQRTFIDLAKKARGDRDRLQPHPPGSET
jgi:hypothetical protein